MMHANEQKTSTFVIAWIVSHGMTNSFKNRLHGSNQRVRTSIYKYWKHITVVSETQWPTRHEHTPTDLCM
jgi:hypothetical protein